MGGRTFPHQKSIEEKGQNGLEEERRLVYVGITRVKKIAYISFSMNRFYQGDWMNSISSRFIDELENNIEKNNQFLRIKMTIMNLIKILIMKKIKSQVG